MCVCVTCVYTQYCVGGGGGALPFLSPTPQPEMPHSDGRPRSGALRPFVGAPLLPPSPSPDERLAAIPIKTRVLTTKTQFL